MKAFVSRDGVVKVEERPIPVPGPHDVIVRTSVASMCSADVAAAVGDFDVVSEGSTHDPANEASSHGIVLGHEAVGKIHALGDRVEGFSVGQRVAAASTTPCGQCENCQRGFGGHCGGTMWGGYTAGVTRDGTLAEYFTVPDARFNVAPIPDRLSDEGALIVTDTLASGSTGLEAANLPLGGVVVIFGQGHVGLGATMTAKLKGAGLVITVKSRPGGEALARSVGADVTLNHSEHDVQAEILRLTNGVGADCVVEASGVKSAFSDAVAATRLGGEVSVLGTYAGDANETLPIPLAHWGWGVGDKKILTTFQRSGSERMRRLMRLVERGLIDPTPLFTHEYPFAEVTRAFNELQNGQAGVVKPLIRFPSSLENASNKEKAIVV